MKTLANLFTEKKALNGTEATKLATETKAFLEKRIELLLTDLLEETGEQFEDDIQDFYERETKTVEEYQGTMTQEQSIDIIVKHLQNTKNFIAEVKKQG